jgi:hypothetical protein
MSVRTWVRTALALGCVAVLSATAQAGIIHRWSFNTAGQAEDSVGTSHGTLVNGAAVAGGQLTLTNGVMAPYVNLPGSGAGGININTYPNATVSIWYTGPAVDPGGFRSVIALGHTSNQPGGEQHGTVVVAEGQGADYFAIQPWRGDNNNRFNISNSNFVGEVGVNGPEKLDGLEHCLIATVTDTAAGADIKYYIDGALIGTTSGAVKMSDLSNDLAYIGRGLYPDPALVGSVNEVRIYDFALTDAQAMSECMGGPDGNPTPEPATVAIASMGLLGLIAVRRRG